MRSILLAVVAAIVPTTAAADVVLPSVPIRVTGGFVVIEPGERQGPPESGPNHSVHLTGSNFELSGFGLGPIDCHVGCLPGQGFSMSADISVRGGTVTFDGRTIEFDALFGPVIGTASVDLFALSPTFAPDDVSSGTFLFRSRFRLEGAATVADFLFAPDGEPIPAIRQWSFSGDGTVTGEYSFPTEPEEPLFRFDRMVYEFDGQSAPVPEPGTMLLLGSGVATVWTRQRKGRGGRSHP
jgi:hypothetical protein